MSLHAKIEAVIYASEEPVTLQQLVGLLAEEAGAELDRMAAAQTMLPLEEQGTGDREQESGNREQRTRPDVDAAFGLDESGSPSENTPSTAEGGPAEDSVDGDRSAGLDSQGEADARQVRQRERAVRDHVRQAVDTLVRTYAESDRGIEIREVASGFRMSTKPEYHDAVRGFVKSLKPALKLTLPALETLAVVAYKQPVTAAEISEIRGVDSAGVLGGLLTRKLIATAGRKQVIGRPMLYKTTRDFLLRFGLKDVTELPSMDEFERLAGELVEQEDLPMENTAALIEQANARGDAEHIRAENALDEGEPEDAEPAETGKRQDNDIREPAATAASAAGGNNGRDKPAAAAPLHTAETGEPDSE